MYAIIQYFASGPLAVAMTGAREIKKRDNPRLYNTVENLAITAGLPMPKVYIINDAAPNAFLRLAEIQNMLLSPLLLDC